MIVSYNWLQTYFKKPLSSPEKLADIFTFAVFEVEGIEKKADDTLIDLKVLPDRAHYALSHRGIARELAAAIGEHIVIPNRTELNVGKTDKLSIQISDSADCRRYIGRRVENVTVGDSPTWLRDRLASIGQRSINNIVDAANFVMFDMGQPLHAFDADKVKGNISVRRTKKGEKMTTLDNREVILDDSMLLIADDEGPLGIAGIKGGTRAAVTRETKNLILEAANFNPTLLRKIAIAINIKTDASKRFENAPSPEQALVAMNEFSALIHGVSPEAVFGEIVDEYPAPLSQKTLSVRVEDISKKLGVEIPEQVVVRILELLDVKVEKKGVVLELTPPYWRLDLVIFEDVVEEVGRLYGYNKVKEVLPPETKVQPVLHKQFYFEYKIRSFLIERGFSEVFTSSFSAAGEVEIEKPLAADKKFLRTDLTRNIEHSLKQNLLNAALLGAKEIREFEIGKIFPKTGEQTSLCVGITGIKSKKEKSINELVREVRDELVAMLGALVQTVCTVDDSGGLILLSGRQIGMINKVDGIFELNLDALISALPEPKEWDVTLPAVEAVTFEQFSLYPCIVRDVAVFVPGGIQADEVWGVISPICDELLVRHDLFDVFDKKSADGSVLTSYAFRLVFQAKDRTLTDIEINAVMEKVTVALNAKENWKVR